MCLGRLGFGEGSGRFWEDEDMVMGFEGGVC